MIQSYDHEITYDPGNRKTIVRDSVGAVTVYEMDEVNAVVAITDAHGGRASYERCPNTGKVLRETNALGEAVEKAYDARGNLVRLTGPDGAATSVRRICSELSPCADRSLPALRSFLGDHASRVDLEFSWIHPQDAIARMRRLEAETSRIRSACS